MQMLFEKLGEAVETFGTEVCMCLMESPVMESVYVIGYLQYVTC